MRGDSNAGQRLGTGLAICRSVIKAHGGEITASNHPEGGAVFSFSIPTKSAAEGQLQNGQPFGTYLQEDIVSRIIQPHVN
ncbi:ATP-binding protein [Phyllobacterium zundukense]|uniref:ATP-binding protein n=1 Tax=Phyllobacterium zundukense TaxID=1867719 RepID=A0ACD4D050_9HYPH|nr:ATP-binding protein [Phyllobacterium zundukense]UXN59191.1 ATP-binding protein [Phyllobacterium zundukense]